MQKKQGTNQGVTNFVAIHTNKKIKMSPDGDFFRTYVDFLQPLHELTKREMDVLALYLQERYNLSKTIYDEENLNRRLMQDDIRVKVREAVGIKPRHLNVILSKFRKKGILIRFGPCKQDEKFDLNLIPHLDKNGACLMIYFTFENEQQRIKLGPQAGKQKAKC